MGLVDYSDSDSDDGSDEQIQRESNGCSVVPGLSDSTTLNGGRCTSTRSDDLKGRDPALSTHDGDGDEHADRKSSNGDPQPVAKRYVTGCAHIDFTRRGS